jgi:glycerate 2-kinase
MDRVREDAVEIFRYALDATRVDVAMEHRIRFEDGVLRIDGNEYLLERYERLVLIAMGKAAGTMARAFLRQAGEFADRFEGVVVAPELAKIGAAARFRVYCGGHPLPNAASMEAAGDVLRTLEGLTELDLVVFLVSGGGSAMIERFLEPTVGVEVVAATHKALVESGAPIAEINVVRKHLSSVKGGRLAAAAAPAEQLTIFVSDVPEGQLDALSSGPTVPDRSTVEEVYRIAAEYGLEARLPALISEMLSKRLLVETPKAGDEIFSRSRWSLLLDSVSLEEAAAVRASELGWAVEIDHRCDDWSAERAAEYLVDRVRELRRERGRVCLVSAGEVTVRVPSGVHGRGGRNQHFALLCSERIAGDEITVLSAGSDGVDGNSSAAGAVVDGTTVARAEKSGYPVSVALEGFNSNVLLTQLGDAIKTGPTGNNLRDLRILQAS